MVKYNKINHLGFLMENKTYKAFCVNDECGYIINRSWSFKPSFVEDEVCPRCQSAYEVREVEDEGLPTSAVLLTGVGEIYSRCPTEFRDLLRKIKKGTPRNNMQNY